MANNRMFLVNKVTGQYVTIAKYYPSTGWKVFGRFSEDANDKLFSGTDCHGFDGETVFEIRYESEGDSSEPN